MPSILIVDRRAVMATEICRVLAAQGCKTTIIAERASPAFRSRFCGHVIVAPPFEDAGAWSAELARTVESETFDAIHICNEEILARVAALRRDDSWSGLLLPPPGRLAVALSKNAARALVAIAGVAIPRTAIPASEAELDPLPRRFKLPLVIKGDSGESGENVRVATSPKELHARYSEIRTREANTLGRPAVQEFIDGAEYSVGGLFSRGRPLRIVAHRKLLRYPYPWGGMSVKGVTERSPSLLLEAFKVFEAFEYSGLGQVEFIRDRRDGRFKFVEINPRLWGTIGVANSAGVDLFTPYRELVKGAKVEPDLRYREGIKFHRILREILFIRARPRRLAGFIRDSLDPSIASDFMWTDPGPHMPSIGRFRKLAHRSMRRMGGEISRFEPSSRRG